MAKIKNFGRKIKKKIRKFLGVPEIPLREEYVEMLRKKGVKVGERVVFYDPQSCKIDSLRPYMIEIGNDVQIPYGVSILAHGYDSLVLDCKYNYSIGSCGNVKIGNNVFIGAKSTILKDVTVGDNVIIGACSVVTKDIPSNSVAAGSPCRVICSLDDYYQKRINAQYSEASKLVKSYRNAFNKEPSKQDLSEYCFLFSNEEEDIENSWKYKMSRTGNYDLTLKNFKEHKPMFNSLEEFLESVK